MPSAKRIIKVLCDRRTLFALPKSLYFNFKYLPLKQAIRLPILIYGGVFLATKGTVKISSTNIHFGMIRLGRKINGLYNPNGSSFSWENLGGSCTFNGRCQIGAGSALVIGPNGDLIFKDDIICGPAFRAASYCQILIGEHSRVSWEVTIVDNDFHALRSLSDDTLASSPLKPILIGSNNWIGMRSLIFKGSKTPNFCILGAYSILSKSLDCEEYSLVAGNPLAVKKRGVYRDLSSNIQ